MTQVQILAIPGSLRAGSWNAALLRLAQERAPEGVRVDIWEGLRHVPPFSEDHEGEATHEAVEELRSVIAAADALRTRVGATDAGDRTRSVEARLAELEDESRAAAQLTRDMAQQINALTLALESAARTARRGLALGIAALVLSVAGVILAIAY